MVFSQLLRRWPRWALPDAFSDPEMRRASLKSPFFCRRKWPCLVLGALQVLSLKAMPGQDQAFGFTCLKKKLFCPHDPEDASWAVMAQVGVDLAGSFKERLGPACSAGGRGSTSCQGARPCRMPRSLRRRPDMGVAGAGRRCGRGRTWVWRHPVVHQAEGPFTLQVWRWGMQCQTRLTSSSSTSFLERKQTV